MLVKLPGRVAPTRDRPGDEGRSKNTPQLPFEKPEVCTFSAAPFARPCPTPRAMRRVLDERCSFFTPWAGNRFPVQSQFGIQRSPPGLDTGSPIVLRPPLLSSLPSLTARATCFQLGRLQPVHDRR